MDLLITQARCGIQQDFVSGKVSLGRPIQESAITLQLECARVKKIECVLNFFLGGDPERKRSLVLDTREIGSIFGVDQQDVVTRIGFGNRLDKFRGPTVALLLVIKAERHGFIHDGTGGGKAFRYRIMIDSGYRFRLII